MVLFTDQVFRNCLWQKLGRKQPNAAESFSHLAERSLREKQSLAECLRSSATCFYYNIAKAVLVSRVKSIIVSPYKECHPLCFVKITYT